MASQSALSANRFPYPKEEAVLRAHVAGAEEERLLLERRRHESLAVVESARRDVVAAERVLEAAREALESAQILHDGITESCRALDARIAVARTRLHPIRRLSDDVLGEIFQFLIETLNAPGLNSLLARTAPFAVAQVCRRWRAAALAQSRLWRYVNLNMDDIGDALLRLDSRAANHPNHSCEWCRFLHFHLLHSRSVHLDLRIFSWDGPHVQGSSHILELLATASSRVRSLKIEWGGDEEGVLELLLHADMPVLESATIDCTSLTIPPSFQPLEIGFFTAAPRLQRCVLHHCRIEWAGEPQVFAGLTCLEVYGGASADYAAKTSEIHSLLSRCPGLERVKIDLAYLTYDDAVPQTTRSYPRITDVTIAVRKQDAAEVTNFLLFPSAVRLDLLLSPLQPSRTMIAACTSTLTSVVIHRRTVGSALALSLTAANLLQSVELVLCKLLETFFVVMATRSEDGRLPCPLLYKLHSRHSYVPPRDESAFTGEALLRLVRLRKYEAAKGAGLSRLSDVAISWSFKAKLTLIDGFEEQLQDLTK